MDLIAKYGKTALVAGASEGLGDAYCRALAKAGMDLIMIARREDKLLKAADKLRSEFNVTVTPVAADLADADIISKIEKATGGLPVNLLIYDAGMPYIGPFLDADVDKHIAITAVNTQSLVRLVHHYGGKMVQQGRGAVIMMSSLSGFQGSGFLTTYASTKAFDRVFGESLWYEWKDKGVDVLVCTAGTIDTPNYTSTNPEESPVTPKAQEPEEVVKEVFAHLGKGPSFISGMSNRMATLAMNLLPNKVAVNIMGDTTRKMYKIRY